jgi:adenylate kinase
LSYHVIYVTGPPATGKSTLVRLLEQSIKPVKLFAYSQVLAESLTLKLAATISQDKLREESAKIITQQDVQAADRDLLALVNGCRGCCNIIVDSHAVTKETYGFRITAFSMEMLLAIRPTLLVSLYSAPAVVIDRIASSPQGRPVVSEFEAEFHNFLQASVAVNYGMQLGLPVYFLDAERSPDALCAEIVKRVSDS